MAAADRPLPKHMLGIAKQSVSGGPKAGEIERHFARIVSALEAHHVDFDLGDEEVIVRNGNAQANTLAIGSSEYTTVIVPPALSWRAETVKKLRRYARKGGSLIAVSPIARQVDFAVSEVIEDLSKEYANVFTVERAGREVSFLVNRLEPRAIRVKPKGGQNADSLLIQHRQTDSNELFHIVNTSRETGVEARVHIYADGAVRFLDSWSPRIYLVDADKEQNAQVFNYTFHAGSSSLFLVGGEGDLTEPPFQRLPHATSTQLLEGAWQFERLDPNALPLSICSLSVDGQEILQDRSVAGVRSKLRELFSASPEGAPVVFIDLRFQIVC